LEAAKNASPTTIGHTVLDGAGMAPIVGEVADPINAGWCLAEGNKLDASLSAAAAIPVIGDAATAAKWGKNAVKATDVATDAAKTVDNVVDGAKTAAPATAVEEGGKLLKGGSKVLEDGGKLIQDGGKAEKGLAEVSKADGKGGRAPIEKGRAGETQSEAEAVAAGEYVKGRQVTFELPSGGRSRPDLLTETPKNELKVREAKNGESAKMTRGQRELEDTVEKGGSVIPRGKNAEKAGLKPGELIKIDKFELDKY